MAANLPSLSTTSSVRPVIQLLSASLVEDFSYILLVLLLFVFLLFFVVLLFLLLLLLKNNINFVV